MKKLSILAISGLVVALALPALASNTGFKLNYELIEGGKNILSVPYFYFPNGDIAAPEQNARDLCGDLMTGDCGPFDATGAVDVVVRLVKTGTTLSAFTHPCLAPVRGFGIEPGEAYFVTVKAGRTCTADIVGSHDDTYSVGGTNTIELTEGNQLISVPYHVQANNAYQLCNDIGDDAGTEPDTLVQIDPVTGGALTHPCLAPTAGFLITPGEGYFMTTTAASLTFHWTTY